jgi:hypothetical protein
VKREREVRHKSEDIEDVVLLDVVQAIRRRVRLVKRFRHSLHRRLQQGRPDGFH